MVTRRFTSKDYNFVAKRLRERFTDVVEGEGHQNTTLKLAKSGVLSMLALEFAEAYLKDNDLFDPLSFLNKCSPDPDVYMLSELWEGYIADSPN